MNWKSIDYRIIVALGVLFFVVIAGIYAIEIPYFNRYFSFSGFLTYSLIFGLILGTFTAWYFSKGQEDAYDKMRLRVGLITTGLLFGPLLFSLVNRHLDPWPKRLERVEFVGQEDRYSSRFGIPDLGEAPEADHVHIYFYRNSHLIRIVFNKKIDLGEVNKGDMIYILVRPGLFGLNWVESIQNEADKPDII